MSLKRTMAKKDKDFGDWKATCLISNKVSIKRYDKGFVIKTRGSLITERISMPLGTSTKDMTDYINGYYSNMKDKERK